MHINANTDELFAPTRGAFLVFILGWLLLHIGWAFVWAAFVWVAYVWVAFVGGGGAFVVPPKNIAAVSDSSERE